MQAQTGLARKLKHTRQNIEDSQLEPLDNYQCKYERATTEDH